jgi:outer membrane protein assembly factor BamA
MRFWSAFRFLVLAVICVCLRLPVVHAQLPRRLEQCLPYPTLAEEIEDMREEVQAKMNLGASPPAPATRGSIEAIKFEGQIHLPATLLNKLITQLKQRGFGSGSEWLDEIQDVPIRAAWQDNGYFRVITTAESRLIDGDFTHLYFSVTVHVDEGLQYRLEDVTFRSSDPDTPLVFPPERLRRLIFLQDGEIFSVDQIRNSLEALKKFYGTQGYIDFTATPFMDLDDSAGLISLRMELDQQKQYRIGKVEVWGPNPEFESLLKSKLKRGDIFDYQAIEDFIKENTSTLPADVSPSDVELRRNVKYGTVDLRFDFAACPDPEDCSQWAVKPCLRVDHSPESKTQ